MGSFSVIVDYTPLAPLREHADRGLLPDGGLFKRFKSEASTILEPKWHDTYVIQMVSGGKGNQTLLIHCEMSRVKAIWSLWNNSYTDIYSSTSSVSSSSLCLSVNEKCIAVPSHS